jgi:hypothetical protein
LPLLLLLVDNPFSVLLFLSFQLLVFGAVSVITRLDYVDWHYLVRSLRWLLPFTIAGVVGLLNLPGTLLSTIAHRINSTHGVNYCG